MAVYLDVIWFLNFCIDLFLLLLTALVLKRKLIKWRIFLGAIIASSAVFLVITPISQLYYHPLFRIAFSASIILAAFGWKRFSCFIQNLVTFYFVSFLCGGGLIGLHYLFNSEMIVLNGVVTTKTSGFGTPISWLFVVIGFPLMWLFAKKQIEQLKVRKVKYEEIVTVDITIFDKHLRLQGLVDSGNQLQDPLTRRPVMILDMNGLEANFPRAIVEQAKSPEKIGSVQAMNEPNWEARLSIIPFRGLGQKNQFIVGIRPHKVVVTLKNHEQLECSQVIIGLSCTNLSADGDFQCILHPSMLIQGKEHRVL